MDDRETQVLLDEVDAVRTELADFHRFSRPIWQARRWRRSRLRHPRLSSCCPVKWTSFAASTFVTWSTP